MGGISIVFLAKKTVYTRYLNQEEKKMTIFLKKGDVIGVAAPSARFDRTLFEKGVARLESMGFQVRIPDGIFGQYRYLAGDDESRARVINDLFADPVVKGIISVRGGYGAMRILGRINWAAARKNPSLFIGFSDASALISALGRRAGLPAIHGPNLVSLAKAAQRTLDGFYQAVTGQLETLALKGGQWIAKGRAEGRLLGGNLATLAHMLGTGFSPDFDKSILFLEDVGEPAYKIDRMLTQMTMAGCFETVQGVVAGSFENCANPVYIPQILHEFFLPKKIPVFMGLEAGHGKINLSLPMGDPVILDSYKQALSWVAG